MVTRKTETPQAPASKPVPELHSHELLRGQRELTIVHSGQRYTLRVTANDKLILTK